MTEWTIGYLEWAYAGFIQFPLKPMAGFTFKRANLKPELANLQMERVSSDELRIYFGQSGPVFWKNDQVGHYWLSYFGNSFV